MARAGAIGERKNSFRATMRADGNPAQGARAMHADPRASDDHLETLTRLNQDYITSVQ
jgi:hypothetical protein